MKSLARTLSIVAIVGTGVGFAAIKLPALLTEPDTILDLQAAPLTSYLPTGNSPIQGVRPRVGQRGVQIDGALRKATPWGLAVAGNPMAANPGTGSHVGGMDVGNGTAEIFDVDLRLPAKGISWVVGRTYNARQIDSGGTHLDSAGYQGKNWFQLSNPELVLYDADSNTATKQAGDYVYLVYGADRYLEFKRTADNKESFRGTNGCAGVIFHTADASGEPGTYMYVDQNGNELYFFDNEPFGSADAGSAALQLWKIVDPAGNVAYFGDPTTASTAITNGYTSGRPHIAIDASDRRYTYSYDGSNRLTGVVADTKTGGTWFSSPTGVVTVGQVAYTYYTSDGDTYGDNNDLKLVEITVPLTDSGVSVTQRKYYRYYEHETAYNSSTYPGNPHQIQLIVGFEGCRNYDYSDTLFDQDYYGESTANLKPYAEAYFEYENVAGARVTKSFMNGQCGCSGATNGIYSFAYSNNGSYTDNSGYDTAWMTRTVVARPDGSYVTQYFDEGYQPLHQVVSDADPANTGPQPSLWLTYVHRTSAGIVDEVDTPSNVTAYTHSTASFTRSSSVGLIWTYSLVGSGHTTENFVSDRLFKDAGSAGSSYYDHSVTYGYAAWQVDAGDTKSQVVRPVVASDSFYVAKVTTSSGNQTTTSFSYTYQGASGKDQIALATRTVTEPVVTTAHNGSNSANSTAKYWNADGTLGFEKTALGYITYHEYTNGRETKRIDDADTSLTAGGQDFNGVTIPTGFSKTGTPLHHKATMTYDAQGRLVSRTVDSYTPLTYYSKLKDERFVTLQYTHSDGVPTYYGPVSYQVTNQAGLSEASGVIGLSSNSSTSALTSMIDETTADVKSAVAVGTLRRLTTNFFDSSGTQMSESRLYTTIPGSLPGSSGTNYDSTKPAYDTMGRVIRTKEPSGTIRRSVYDARGQVTELWVGTDDTGLTGSDCAGTSNMLKTESLQFDSGSDKGNGYLTQRTLYLDDVPNTRVTAFTNDVFGRPVLIAPPTTPYTLNLYDNLHRVIATGRYTSTSGLSASSDPTSIATNRRALSETKYDELGRVYETIRHKINTANGNDLDTLTSNYWFNADRRLAKVQGPTLEKIDEDRRYRELHRYTLANTNDASYSDALDITGDVVLEERDSTYDSSDGKVIMRAHFQRNHDNVGGGGTTGALDTNADGDSLKITMSNTTGSRVQITAIWNGLQGVTDEVQYGTNGGSDFNRSGLSVPSRSTSALRTTYTYDTDGTVSLIQDPSVAAARYTSFTRDDAGRKITEIKNYLSGTNGGAPYSTDINVTTRWAYTNGLMTSLTADLPSGQTDQVTTYTYGTTKGSSAGDSKVATGHLLQKVTYPDSSDSGDVVKFAYNGQEEEIWHKDQEPSGTTANVIESDYDGVGRKTERRVTTLGTNFDGAVRRIETNYDTLGRQHLVTQYDNATVGSGSVVNEVRFTYDGWGNLTAYEEDPNSAVDAASSVDDFEVDYTYSKATSGRQALGRATAALSFGTGAAIKTFTYNYSSNYDSDAVRVSKVKDGATVLAEYEYLGSGFVVGDNRPGPAIFSKQHSLVSSGTYSQLDDLNRRTSDVWTKDLPTDKDFFKNSITWDENSNITVVQDNVQTGFDVKYTLDGIDRVTEAKEGTWNGSSITSKTRDQIWTLTHTGNWSEEKLDLNGDGDFVDTNEHDDTRTHNDANELTAQDTDTNGSNNYTLAYDPAGNLTDDGQNYKYVYDAFYRLRKINTQGGALVKEMAYNGEGHQIWSQWDNDRSTQNGSPDGTVDHYDHRFYYANDEMWRQVATYRDADGSPRVIDSTPKEIFIPQQAGTDGLAGSSYVNGVICRYKDANTAWTSASDGVLEQTHHYAQNWRGDVVSLIDSGGTMVEWDKYSAYGVPFGLPKGDTNSDGACNGTDATQIQTWINTSQYDVRGDLDLDGDVDTTDKTTAQGVTGTLGRTVLSGVGNRCELAGYSFDDIAVGTLCSVRHRVLSCSLGRWYTRDPVDDDDSSNMYEYALGQPIIREDADGQASTLASANCECVPNLKFYQLAHGRRLRRIQRCLGYPSVSITVGPGNCCVSNDNCKFHAIIQMSTIIGTPCKYQIGTGLGGGMKLGQPQWGILYYNQSGEMPCGGSTNLDIVINDIPLLTVALWCTNPCKS